MRSTWWLDESELDEQQLNVIRLGVDESSVLITGQPGSGKTNLALLRANYLVLANLPNVVVLTIGKAISNFILAGAKLHGLDSDNVQTFHKWGRRLVINAGETPHATSTDYEESLVALIAQLNGLADQNKLYSYDAIIVDEAQDYPPGCAELFRKITKRLFVTGDERQRLFSGTAQTLSEFRDGATIIELDHHYRNGRNICLLAGALRGYDYAASSRYDETANPSTLRRHRCSNLEEQIEQAVSAIPNQLAAYPNDLVGIMVPTNATLQEVIALLDESDISDQVQLQSSDAGYSELDPDKRVIALTLHSAKGMEFRSAHIFCADELTSWRDTQEHRNLVFTAVTRAKTSLDIYHAGTLKKWFESALLKVLSRPQAPESLSSLFPKATAS